MKIVPNVLSAFLLVGLAHAQPVITGGPVNAASYALAGLPNANIAQGSMFILFGRNLGPSTQANASSFPLPANLGGTSISVTVGGTAVNAIMLYSNSSQVAAILPSTTPIGAGMLTLSLNSNASNAVPIQVVPNTLGIFTRNQSGSGPGVLFNFNSQADQPLNSLVTAAHPGQVLTLWGTGLGAVSGNEADGPLPGNLSVPVSVYVGNQLVTPTYKGRSGCCAGIDQIVFTVPQGVEGCYVSVAVVAGGVTSNFATIAVTDSGTVCSDPTGFSTADLQTVQKGGTLTVADLQVANIELSDPALGAGEQTIQLGAGHFRNYATSGDVLASTRGSVGGLSGLPSVGSCNANSLSYQSYISSAVPSSNDPVNQTGLNAGAALEITGPPGAQQWPRQNKGSAAQPDYAYGMQGSVIGGGVPNQTPVLPLYLAPGNFTIDDGSGGPQVGPFSAMLTIPSSTVAWTNASAFNNISRSNDLTVTWSGGVSGGIVAVLGSSADPSAGAEAQFACVTDAGAGTFTVPAWVLSALPASATDPSVAAKVGFLTVATARPAPTRFQATGVDVGFFNWGQLQVKSVVYQ
jgi:uncharacterized protein (TIGR03437 family)